MKSITAHEIVNIFTIDSIDSLHCTAMPRIQHIYFCIIFLKLTITISNSYKISVYDSSRSEDGKPRLVQTIGNHVDFHVHENFFENFVTEMLELLITGFPRRLLKSYVRHVYIELDKLEYTYTQKLGKIFRDLSTDRDKIKSLMESYQKELKRRPPHLMQFLSNMNTKFTAEQGVEFKNYILDVKDYGNLMKKDVRKETRALLYMIINTITKLSREDQIKLENTLRDAVKEHKAKGF